MVDHANPDESAAFRALSQELFACTPAALPGAQAVDGLFAYLTQFFPKAMQPPNGKLV